MVPSRDITHSDSCVNQCFDFFLAECPLFPWQLHSTVFFSMLFGTFHLVFCYLNFCSQAPLQMVSQQTPESIWQFHMLGIHKYLCDRLCFAEVSAALTATHVCHATSRWIVLIQSCVPFSTLLNVERNYDSSSFSYLRGYVPRPLVNA